MNTLLSIWARSLVCLLVAAGSTLGFTLDAVSSQPPNILFIYLDDFGWKDASFMGSDFYETPNLDQLAREGMVFTDAYAGAANCAPSRACLLSGQYSSRHRIYNVGTKPRGKAQHRRLEHIAGTDILDPAIETWAEVAQGLGYRTATIGKWHLSPDPIPYGFDVNIGGGHSGSPPRGYYPPHPRVPGLEDAPADEYLTDRLTDEAIKFMADSAGKSWLLYLTHFAVHTPLHAKRELVAKYEAKNAGLLHDHVAMATMVQAVDDGVGRIRHYLEERDLLENTIIVFSSDNGGYGPATDMEPLKGYKGTYYEGGIRVPFFVRWPGVVKPGSRSHEPVSAVDVHPTLCAMMGGRTLGAQISDGKNLVPLLKGEVDRLEDRALFWHFPAYLQAYSVIDEQRDPLFRSRPCTIMRAGQWKLHHYFEDNALELYDLDTDIGERFNLARVRPVLTDKLYKRLVAWRQQTGADLPVQLNPAFDAAAEREAIERVLEGRR